jgi:glycosyltransferase involved in cell wall biosynthesis
LTSRRLWRQERAIPPDGPLRVTLVGPSLDILGGQAVQASRLLGRFASSPALAPDFLPVNPRLPGPFRLLQRIKYVRTVVTFAAYVWSLLRRLPGTEVVHAFSASYWSFLLAPAPALVLGRLLGRRVVLNYRSGEAEDHLRRWRRIALPLMRLADRIVVPSGYLVEVFARFGLPATAISNFVDVEQIPFRARPALRPRFLSNRNFEAHYNIPCVLRAFARIQAVVPEAQLALVGQGKERPALERLARELGLREVTFAGAVSPERMEGFYAAADIYLNAPDIDNMPTSIIEAFAAGLPVVSTSAGGIPWIVRNQENGLLVPRNDDAAMASESLRLLSDASLASRIAATAYAEVLARFTWPAVEEEWIRLYRDLARPAESPR